MFRWASDDADEEIMARARNEGRMLRFGLDYLDVASEGIFPNDMILIGAATGIGKTQLCCLIAQANLQDGKTVHYIALEAHRYEIQQRLKFPLVMKHYLNDPNRKPLKITFQKWLSGSLLGELANYEVEAAKEFKELYKRLALYGKGELFGIKELKTSVRLAAKETDIILIDHAHYFDFEEENENKALKEIAKNARQLAIDEDKPILLVAHLRKKDRYNDDLIPGLDEFMGSSDLSKIATRAVTLAPGPRTFDGFYETYFRVSKNRTGGEVSRFAGKELFNPKTGEYLHGHYEIGYSGQKQGKPFQSLDKSLYPDWAR